MRNLKPSQLLFLGSLGVFTATLILLVILLFSGIEIPITALLSVPFFAGIVSFAIFYFFVKQFINERLKLLYRSIRKGKITKENEFTFNFNDDPISVAEVETKKWTEAKQNEISRLKEQEEFRREFLGNLAHELKTPIFSIQGYLLTLLEGGLEDDKVNTMFLDRASKATDRMVSLIEDLDQITKLEVEGLQIEMKQFVLNDLVLEIFESLEMAAGEKNITLRFAKSYDPIYVLADRAKIAQVFTNLISNSISYGNVDGETLVRFYSVDDLVTIEVSDNGPGISDASIPRLFERFYRVEKSRNRNDGGSGLGLSIAKHIVEAHGQNISVRSTEGVGSTFIFALDKAD